MFVVVAYVGADFALKIQFVILAILVAALVSFFAGGWGDVGSPTTTASYTDGVTFWVVFAVFFPAVTGIEVGISLSGDLKDPSRSIPVGTIASIAVTAVVYILAAVWFSTHLSPAELIDNTSAMSEIAAVPALILAGVAASTLSSALGSVLAAPRTLQAVAGDRVVPRWMASQMGSATEPRAAVLLTGVVAVAVIWAGDLDVVAPIITMFFLNTYGMVNLVAAIEKGVGNPSFRPTFAVKWWVPALGALGCYGAMFLINAPATVAAIVVTYGIYFALRRREVVGRWGDVRSGVWTSLARFALLKLERGGGGGDSRNWRPNLMVFTGQPHNREHLVALADWLSLGRGVVTFSQLITGRVEEPNKPALRAQARERIRTYISDHRMAAFAEAQIVSDFAEGAVAVSQAHGIGPARVQHGRDGVEPDARRPRAPARRAPRPRRAGASRPCSSTSTAIAGSAVAGRSTCGGAGGAATATSCSSWPTSSPATATGTGPRSASSASSGAPKPSTASARTPRRCWRRSASRPRLFFRLAQVRFLLPPLRQRPEDIPLLVEHFLEQQVERTGRKPALEPSAMRWIQQYDWPGNIRELRNAIEKAVALSTHGVITADYFQEELSEHIYAPRTPSQLSASAPAPPGVPSDTPAPRPTDAPGAPGAPIQYASPRDRQWAQAHTRILTEDRDIVAFKEAKEEIIAMFERQYLTMLLDRTGQNISKAARKAGIDRRHFYRLLKKHEIEVD